MARKESCIYRTAGSRNQGSFSVLPFQIPQADCSGCQILAQQGAKDSTCYNLDMNERNCTISPLSKPLSKGSQTDLENMSQDL